MTRKIPDRNDPTKIVGEVPVLEWVYEITHISGNKQIWSITSKKLAAKILNQLITFNEKNNELVSNFHNHLKCNDECGGSSGVVSNDESQHSNTNCSDKSNSPQRDETSCKTNSHDKPDNDD